MGNNMGRETWDVRREGTWDVKTLNHKISDIYKELNT